MIRIGHLLLLLLLSPFAVAGADSDEHVVIIGDHNAVTASDMQLALRALGIKVNAFTYEYPTYHCLRFEASTYASAELQQSLPTGRVCSPGGQTRLVIVEKTEQTDSRQLESVSFRIGTKIGSIHTASFPLGGVGGKTSGAYGEVSLQETTSAPLYVFAANDKEVLGFRTDIPLDEAVKGYAYAVVLSVQMEIPELAEPNMP